VKPSHDLARKLWLYRLLLSIRPAQLADFAKKCCRIGRIEVVTVTGAKFWIDPVSIFGLSILKQGEFEKPLTRAVLTLLRPGDSFVDVGANEGCFSALAARKVGANGRVLAIEPQRRLHDVLKRNIAANSLTNVDVVSAAVADKEGKTLLYLRPSTNTGASSFTKHWRFGNRTEEVHMTTLDRLLSERNFASVRLMKVDCEGAEPPVIAGVKNALRARRIEIIVVDCHPKIVSVTECQRTHRRFLESGYHAAKRSKLLFYFVASAKEDLGRLGQLSKIPDWLE
jgi:FkbM family methyltransferase